MNHSSIFVASRPEPSEQEISAYAFRLYQESHCEPGHELDHWRAATARLKANISDAQFAPEEWELMVDL